MQRAEFTLEHLIYLIIFVLVVILIVTVLSDKLGGIFSG